MERIRAVRSCVNSSKLLNSFQVEGIASKSIWLRIRRCISVLFILDILCFRYVNDGCSTHRDGLDRSLSEAHSNYKPLVIIREDRNQLTVCCSADMVLRNILRFKIPLFYSKIPHIEGYDDSLDRTHFDTFDTCLTCPD